MSETSTIIFNRVLRINYCQADARIVDSDRARLEKILHQLGSVQIRAVKSLSELWQTPADLSVVAAQTVPPEHFSSWLRVFRGNVLDQGGVWTPALILANLPFMVLNDILAEAVQDNWYFDIVAVDQISSLPIRIANLIRIHDHLRELQKYASALDALDAKVRKLEDDLEVLKNR